MQRFLDMVRPKPANNLLILFYFTDCFFSIHSNLTGNSIKILDNGVFGFLPMLSWL